MLPHVGWNSRQSWTLTSTQTSCGVCFCSSRIHFSPRRNECVMNKNKPHRTSAGRLSWTLDFRPLNPDARHWVPDSLSVELGFRILIFKWDSGFQSPGFLILPAKLSLIPDSASQNFKASVSFSRGIDGSFIPFNESFTCTHTLVNKLDKYGKAT